MASDSRERILADSQFGSGATSYSPATWYFGLSTTTPNDDGSNFTEPSSGSYARVAVTNNTTNFPAATTVSGETRKTNGAKITWPNPTANWGTITHVVVFTTSTVNSGTADYVFPLEQPISPRSTTTPVEFDTGALVMLWS
jgi:hypothetical protein